MTSSDSWDDTAIARGVPAEEITSEHLQDEALALSLAELSSGDESRWAETVNAAINPAGRKFDRSTVFVFTVLAAASIALFVFGLIYYFN